MSTKCIVHLNLSFNFLLEIKFCFSLIIFCFGRIKAATSELKCIFKKKKKIFNKKKVKKNILIANMSRYNQSSGSQTQTYRAIVVGGGGVGKSAITIQFIQVSGIQIRKSFSIDKYKYRCTWSIYIRFVKQDPWSNNRNIPKRRIKASSKPIRWMKCFHIERLCVLKKK